MKTTRIWLLAGALIFALLQACDTSPGAQYKERVRTELTSGVRYDSLFFGLYLGMPQKDFFEQCWKMNQQRILRQGPTNRSVQYVLPNMAEETHMNFYPNFYENRIFEMPLVFTYAAWSPWNRHLFADSLKPKVIQLMEDWYGPGFIRIDPPTDREANPIHVKVDGNRQIKVMERDDQYVEVIITDLSNKAALEAQKRRAQNDSTLGHN